MAHINGEMETITKIQDQYIARKTLIASAIMGTTERFAMERFARQEAHRKLADCGLTGAQVAQALKDAVDVFELNMLPPPPKRKTTPKASFR